jgi:hypothetical protein
MGAGRDRLIFVKAVFDHGQIELGRVRLVKGLVADQAHRGCFGLKKRQALIVHVQLESMEEVLAGRAVVADSAFDHALLASQLLASLADTYVVLGLAAAAVLEGAPAASFA